MNVQKDLRRARKALATSPTDGVLACLAILSQSPGNGSARSLLRKMGAAERRRVLNDVSTLFGSGDWTHALRILEPLGRAHPADAALAEAEARCWMALGQWQKMADRLAAPLAKSPDHAGVLTATGVALFNLGRAEAALAHLQKAAALRPFDPHVQTHLGGVLLSLGRLDAARDAFRAAVSESGGVPEAWPNLAGLIDFAAEPELAARLDRLAPGAAKSDTQRECLAFARAKAAFDRDRPDDGFAQLHRANALHRAKLDHDAGRERADTLDLIARLPKGLALTSPGAPRPVLIVGMPRSGTTLVEQILAAHPQVAGLGELRDLSQLVGKLDTGHPWTEAQLQALADGYRAALAPADKPVAVDKMPGNALQAGFALAALPDAQVLHMRRDPVATGFSNYRKRFTDGTSFAFDLTEIAQRARLIDEVMAIWQARFPGRVHDVVYENVVADPARAIAELLQRLDLPPDDACLGFAGAQGDIRTASTAQVRGPVARQNSADWQPYAAHLAPLIAGLGDLTLCHDKMRVPES